MKCNQIGLSFEVCKLEIFQILTFFWVPGPGPGLALGLGWAWAWPGLGPGLGPGPGLGLGLGLGWVQWEGPGGAKGFRV